MRLRSPRSARSVEQAGDRFAVELARAHHCRPGCPGCEAERSQSPAVDLTSRHERFVASAHALRVARHCKRSGRPFPVVSADEVVQFCVEEAVFERLMTAERLSGEATREALATLGQDEPHPGAPPGLAAAVEAAEHFRRTGERI